MNEHQKSENAQTVMNTRAYLKHRKSDNNYTKKYFGEKNETSLVAVLAVCGIAAVSSFFVADYFQGTDIKLDATVLRHYTSRSHVKGQTNRILKHVDIDISGDTTGVQVSDEEYDSLEDGKSYEITVRECKYTGWGRNIRF